MHRHIVSQSGDNSFIQFKLSLVSLLTDDLRHNKSEDIPSNEISVVLGEIDSSHYLLDNIGVKVDTCWLWKILAPEKILRTKYGFTKCRKSFHVNCYSSFHFCTSLETKKNTLSRLIGYSYNNGKRNIESTVVWSSLSDITMTIDDTRKKRKSNGLFPDTGFLTITFK